MSTSKPHSELVATVRAGIGSTWTSDDATNKRKYRKAQDALSNLIEQLEATEQRLAREISEHADREQALRQLQFLAVNGQNRHSDSLEALREIESRAREALNPASRSDDA